MWQVGINFLVVLLMTSIITLRGWFSLFFGAPVVLFLWVNPIQGVIVGLGVAAL